MRYRKTGGLIILMIILAISANAEDSTMTYWPVTGGGGTDASSIDYRVLGTIGQTSTSHTTAATYQVQAGFWQDIMGGQPCNCRPGDPDNSGDFHLVDITYMINFVYQGGIPPIPNNICSGDPNLDCNINILDIIYLIDHLFQEGPMPLSCQDWVSNCGAVY